MRALDYGEAYIFSKEECNIIRQWFNAVQDIHPVYLTAADYELAKAVHEALGMRVPLSITEKLEEPLCE